MSKKHKKKRKRRKTSKPRELTYIDFRQAGFELVELYAYDSDGDVIRVKTWTINGCTEAEAERRLPGSTEWLRKRMAGFKFKHSESFGAGLNPRVMNRAALLRRRLRHDSTAYSGY